MIFQFHFHILLAYPLFAFVNSIAQPKLRMWRYRPLWLVVIWNKPAVNNSWALIRSHVPKRKWPLIEIMNHAGRFYWVDYMKFGYLYWHARVNDWLKKISTWIILLILSLLCEYVCIYIQRNQSTNLYLLFLQLRVLWECFSSFGFYDFFSIRYTCSFIWRIWEGDHEWISGNFWNLAMASCSLKANVTILRKIRQNKSGQFTTNRVATWQTQQLDRNSTN